MSSTLVYQEFSHSQSLNLKLNNPSKLTFSNSSPSNIDTKCIWSDIESLSSYKKPEKEIEYVHPSTKRFSLSDRSLEMCTESLGSETGVFFTDSLLYFSTTTNIINKKSASGNNNNSNYCFPPPLTTMTGANTLKVRPYREDGRLVIEAVLPSVSRGGSCLKAERSHGRLRMSLVREIEAIVEEEEKESEVAIEKGNLGNHNNNNNNNNCNNNNNNNVEEGELGGVKLKGEDKNEKVILRNVDFGGKMGKGEPNYELSQRGKLGNSTNCRCKGGESGNMNMNMKRLINWESFWVAT